MHTLEKFNFDQKKALIRVDFNVPLNDDFNVTDDTRIRAAKETIIAILEQGGSCILMSHLGRPKGKEAQYSLKHIVNSVSEVMGVTCKFVDDCIGEKAMAAAKALQPGEILLLENLRFYEEEKKGDETFAKQLAELGDIYVNDAFGTAHRAHASTAVVASFFPNNKCFGKLLAKEIESIDKVMQSGEKPITAILGGAKVSSKITIIENILDKVDHIIIGGGMTFTFIKALGGEIGNSLVENEFLSLAKTILDKAEAKGVKIHLPVDAKIANEFSNEAQTQIVDTYSIPAGWMGLDVGPETNKKFEAILAESKTILWNGPLGVFELPNFSQGTINLGNAIASATEKGAFSLVGGGDSVAAAKQFGFTNKVSYVSTGGGAMLESLEGKTLPGIAAITAQ